MLIPFHEEFISRIKNDPFLGEHLLDALTTTIPISIRLNPIKSSPFFLDKELLNWCSNAYYLSTRPLFTLDPLFHAGCYYPQEAGSMLLDWVLRSLDLKDEPKILDLCAAPGGKSTLIASYLEGKGFLVSNELINHRVKVLRENLSKWGYTNTIVTNNQPSDFSQLPNFFDLVVVDAPCSGEGMFRKDPASRREWSPENVSFCSNRQKQIISQIWDCITENGYLIYSTCTFNPQENEETIAWLLEKFEAELVGISLPDTFIKGRNGIGIYGIPGRSKTEGFFIAVVRKTKKTNSDSLPNKTTKKSLSPIVGKELMNLENFCKLSATSIFEWNQNLLAVPILHATDFLIIQSHFHILKWGTRLGEITQKGIVPHQDLAMNPTILNVNDPINVSKKEALQYLHGDTFSLTSDQGVKLISYENEPLGWIKHLGNRFNNLYPKEWRIRMSID